MDGQYGLEIIYCSPLARIKCCHFLFLQTVDMFAHLYVKPGQQTTVWDQPVYFLNDTSGHFQQGFWWQKWIFWIFPALSQNMIFSSTLTEWFLCPKPNQILTRALSQHKIEKIKCKEAQGFNMSTCCLVLHLCLYNISEEAVGWSAGELAARMEEQTEAVLWLHTNIKKLLWLQSLMHTDLL